MMCDGVCSAHQALIRAAPSRRRGRARARRRSGRGAQLALQVGCVFTQRGRPRGGRLRRGLRRRQARERLGVRRRRRLRKNSVSGVHSLSMGEAHDAAAEEHMLSTVHNQKTLGSSR